MIVWHDAKRRCMHTPSWLVGAEGLARVHTEEGDLLAMGVGAASMLAWNREVEWSDCGEDWRCAVYGDGPEPWRNERPIPWAIPLTIEDGAGVEWRVPAILTPLGTACMDMRSRLTVDGWVREPVNGISKRAYDACRAMQPLAAADKLHEATLDQLNDATAAILEACYYLNALTIGRLGLITGTLTRHGIRVACGVMDGPSA